MLSLLSSESNSVTLINLLRRPPLFSPRLLARLLPTSPSPYLRIGPKQGKFLCYHRSDQLGAVLIKLERIIRSFARPKNMIRTLKLPQLITCCLYVIIRIRKGTYTLREVLLLCTTKGNSRISAAEKTPRHFRPKSIDQQHGSNSNSEHTGRYWQRFRLETLLIVPERHLP